MLKLNAIEFVFPDGPEMQSLAERLKREFETYRVPAAVVKKTGIRTISDVADPWLIVLCTPETPACPEVRERIAAFTASGNYHRILTLLVDGAPEQSFPRELVYETLPDGTEVIHEPLAANVTAETEKERIRRLSVEKLRLFAPILGVSFDELRNRRLRTQMQIAAAVSAVVLLGAAAFAVYAFSRMTVIAGQNAALEEQYALAEAERVKAQEQRDAAREEYAGTTAIRAREAMEKGDSELAMLLCLEFLPESGQTTDLPAVLDEALHRICGKGYVPVTSVREYAKTRYKKTEEASAGKADGGFPETITMPVPEEYDNGDETFELKREVFSGEYGYAVYKGYFDFSRSDSHDVYRTRVCFRDEPERDHYLPFSMDAEKSISASVILPDGSFIGTEEAYPQYSLYRYDPFTEEFLPFYDEAGEASGAGTGERSGEASGEGAGERSGETSGEGPGEESVSSVLPGDPAACEEAGIHIEEAPGRPVEAETFSPFALDSGIRYFCTVEGADGLVFGYTRYSTSTFGLEEPDVKTYVFSAEPLRYLYTIDSAMLVFRPEGCRGILGTGMDGLMVFSADPFAYRYTLKDEWDFSFYEYPYITPFFPDGRNWLYYRGSSSSIRTGFKAVYDLDTGQRLSLITGPEQDNDLEVSSEGLILSAARMVPTLWRPEDGSFFADIPGVKEEDPELFGPYDEETGRRSAMALRAGSCVYEYREAERQVPEDLQGKISLAEELLNGRKLTKRERKTYHLELQ